MSIAPAYSTTLAEVSSPVTSPTGGLASTGAGPVGVELGLVAALIVAGVGALVAARRRKGGHA